jgi:hypothetical protein
MTQLAMILKESPHSPAGGGVGHRRLGERCRQSSGVALCNSHREVLLVEMQFFFRDDIRLADAVFRIVDLLDEEYGVRETRKGYPSLAVGGSNKRFHETVLLSWLKSMVVVMASDNGPL